MSVKAIKRPAPVRAAFVRFIELAREIPEVEYVAMSHGGPAEVFTFIPKLVDEVCYRVIRAKNSVLREFPESEIEFHVRALNGHSIETMMEPSEIYFDARRNA